MPAHPSTQAPNAAASIDAVIFERRLPQGFAVGVKTSAIEPEAVLMTEELDFARAFSPLRLRTFAAGRTALRLALHREGLTVGPVLPGPRGAPHLRDLPAVSASLSHKESVAVALVEVHARGSRVGIDVELDRPLRFDLSKRVLTDEELAELGSLAPEARSGFVVRRFSAKEALYKAIDPFLQRYVGFREVRLHDGAGGDFRAELLFENELEASGRIFELDACVGEPGEPSSRVIVSVVRARVRGAFSRPSESSPGD